MSDPAGTASAAGADVTRADVAGGARLAMVARLGAVVELVAQPAYTWLFGIATYGVYTVLWAAVNIVENIVDLSMTQALQRVVPTSDDADAHAAVRFAILVAVIPAILIAVGVGFAAPQIASWISAAPADRATLTTAVALFAWALPLWTFVEVATSAARARRAFGPEIRLRIFWEQVARLAFAVLFFGLGVHRLGLVVAHLCSLGVTAVLAARLLGRYYDVRLLLSAQATSALRRDLLTTGVALLPGAVVRRMFADLPPIILNLLLPGAQGAAAAGQFGIARKIASLPLMVRQAFQYVLAPLSSAQAVRDRAAIGALFRFASRVSTALVVPMTGLLILLASDILSVFAPGTEAALPLIVILSVGRGIEAMLGAATPVVEMIGHRILPLVNSLVGLAASGALAWWLTPLMGGTGMAIAVSVGVVIAAGAATVELRVSDGIRLIDVKLLRGLAAAIAGVVLMWALGEAARPFGAPARAALVAILYLAVSWGALRIGLGASDRRALGRTGRRLWLTPANS